MVAIILDVCIYNLLDKLYVFIFHLVAGNDD